MLLARGLLLWGKSDILTKINNTKRPHDKTRKILEDIIQLLHTCKGIVSRKCRRTRITSNLVSRLSRKVIYEVCSCFLLLDGTFSTFYYYINGDGRQMEKSGCQNKYHVDQKHLKKQNLSSQEAKIKVLLMLIPSS